MKTRKRTQRASAWSQSLEFRMIGQTAIRRWNAKRHLLPKCEAVRRDGELCRQLGLENGRCRWHGGVTPSGDQWHRRRWPAKGNPRAEQRLGRKLQDAERQSKQRKRRLATMTAEERAQHDAWHRAHLPGAAAPRARERSIRHRDFEAAELLRRLRKPSDPEAAALHAEADQLEVQLRELRAVSEEIPFREGVFE
jgi:hypothetical protein